MFGEQKIMEMAVGEARSIPNPSGRGEGALLLDSYSATLLQYRNPWEVRGVYAWVGRLREYEQFAGLEDSQLMAAASVVAEIREDINGTLGHAIAGVPEARLRRLLVCQRGEELSTHLSRLLRMVRGRAPVADTIETVAYWGDVRRRKIAQDYFSATMAGNER